MSENRSLGAAFSFGYYLGMQGRSECLDEEPEPCDDCACALSDDNAEVETIECEVDPTDEFPTMIRDGLEDVTEVTEDDLVQRVELCPSKLTVTVQRG